MITINSRRKSSGLLWSRIAFGFTGSLLLLFSLVSIASSSAAQRGRDRDDNRAIGRLTDFRGDVDIQEQGRDWRNARPGMDLPLNFDVRVARGSEANLEFADGQRITVGEDSLVQARASFDRGHISRIELTLRAGLLRARVEQSRSLRADFDIYTPNARIDVQGGTFSIRYEDHRQITRVAVNDGRLEVESVNGAFRTAVVNRGETIEVTPMGVNPFRGDFDRWDDDRDRPPFGGPPQGGPPPIIIQPPMGGGQMGGVCIQEGSSMASTDRDNHFRWAREHNTQDIETNMRMKLEMLFRCNLLNGNQLANLFADISVAVARNVPNPGCFNGDRGSTGTDRRKHLDWARDKGPQLMLENVEWKVGAALQCTDHDRQAELFADVSVIIAQGRVRM
jgi:hypothetical protein